MATANSPPRGGCIIDRLLAIDGEDWVKLALIEHPGLFWQAQRQAKGCKKCADLLTRLFPDGVPEHHDLGGFTVSDLERVFGELQEKHTKGEPPGSEQRGGGG